MQARRTTRRAGTVAGTLAGTPVATIPPVTVDPTLLALVRGVRELAVGGSS